MKGANWMIWDNFKLIYRGMEPNVINPILISALENLDTESPMGKSVYERAIAAKSAAESAIGGSDGQSMFNALKAIYAVENDVEESVKIFAELMTAIEGLIELNSSDDAEVTEFIETVMGNIEEHSYENEDVPELLIQVKKFRTKLRLPADYAEASELNPIDMPIIDTPTFDDGEGANSVDGWNADGYNFGNDETQKSALALEFYNKTFDLNQTIYGVPAGNYILKVNSFARLDAEKTNPVYLYAVTGGEEFKIELVDLVDDGSIGDMVSAVAAFDEGNYLNELPVTVGADGVLRIGIKKETNETSTTDWVIMDNWSLWYIGNGGAITIIGDVNGDGSVDVADISAIISQMAGTATYPAADVNNDGSVDVADISKVISIMAEKARLAKAAIGEE
jgi:hypothetical protein